MAIFHHFPMPMVMNHGLGFQDSTRLHFKSKSRSNFPYSFLYSATLQDSQVSTLISLSYKWVFSEFSPFSLLSSLSSDFKLSLFYFETNQVLYSFTSKIQYLSSFFTPLGCWLLLLLPHSPPDAVVFTPSVFSAS